MNDFSKMTKADLMVEVGRLRAELEGAATVVAERAVPAPPQPVMEAEALAACIRALNPAIGATPSGTYGRPSAQDEGRQAIERILRLLASKYGIRLIERQTQPCDRQHADTMSPRELVDAGLKRMDAGEYFGTTGQFQGGRL